MRTCNHRPGQNALVQQVSRHRDIWQPVQRPSNFWNSDFPTDEVLEKQRQEEDKRNAERLKEIAQEAEAGTGRWTKKVK